MAQAIGHIRMMSYKSIPTAKMINDKDETMGEKLSKVKFRDLDPKNTR